MKKITMDVFFSLDTTKTTQKQRRKTFVNYKKANWSAYKVDTESLFASLDTTNITETTYRTITTQFNYIITKTGEKHIP